MGGKERVALVTGGSRGIGAACVRSLRGRGLEVAFTYCEHLEEAQRIAAETGAMPFHLDLRDSGEIGQLAAQVTKDVGPVTILVHNAGLIQDTLLAFLTPEVWDEVMQVDLRGPFLLTERLLRGMLRERWGRVVSIASLSGVAGHVGQCHYSAAKAGLMAFTKSLAREVAGYGVTANSIAPGFIDTDMLAPLPEKKVEQDKKEIPLGRFGRPEEVAGLVAYLTSELAGTLPARSSGSTAASPCPDTPVLA